jgi:hypothetical protein
MNRGIVFRPEALRELEGEIDWYKFCDKGFNLISSVSERIYPGLLLLLLGIPQEPNARSFAPMLKIA